MEITSTEPIAPLTVSLANAAKMLDVSRQTVWRLCRAEQLVEVRVRGRVLVTLASLHALIERGKASAA
jgi:hypothetical protein